MERRELIALVKQCTHASMAEGRSGEERYHFIEMAKLAISQSVQLGEKSSAELQILIEHIPQLNLSTTPLLEGE